MPFHFDDFYFTAYLIIGLGIFFDGMLNVRITLGEVPKAAMLLVLILTGVLYAVFWPIIVLIILYMGLKNTK
mgnify:CR=1 FL=1